VGITGGIAAYKACEVVRGLQKAGCEVRVCMTPAATEFVGPLTLRALTGHEVLLDLFTCEESPIAHIDWAHWAQAIVVVPASANTLAAMAAGAANNALTSLLLAATCPVVVAPAMNTAMWYHAATQANVATLEARGVSVVAPAAGRLACGDEGAGKLAPVEDVVAATLAALNAGAGAGASASVTSAGALPAQTLAGARVVITAGPTQEPIDAVRYISNRSSGKMGFALAAEAAARGAAVTLITGPVALETPTVPAGAGSIERVDVSCAHDMYDATLAQVEDAQVVICSAAVADFTPAHPATHKLKKGIDEPTHLELAPTQDILAAVCARPHTYVTVGFAAETSNALAYAQDKLARKGADVIVANDVSRADSTFGAETDAITLVDAAGYQAFPPQPKRACASCILDYVVARRASVG
jgi:phosphopantothenoylcysteine decarboxylase/phosphopantothenate--cysteine ligase